MKRILAIVVFALGTAAYTSVTGAEPPRESHQFRPQWQVGDQWVVETATRQPQTASHQPVKAKARWRFVVEAVEPVAQADCFRIVCRPVDAQEPRTVVWVDREATAIRQIQTQLPTPAGYKTVTESYQSTTAAPVVGPLTVLPIALPQFSQPSIKSLDAYQYETISGPGGIKAAGDVGFSTDIRQTFSKPSADGVKGLFDEHIKSLEDRPLVEVHLSTPVEAVRQVWAQGAPWPVFADNGLTVARLIQATRAADSRGDPGLGRREQPPAAQPTSDSDGIKHLETRDGLERGTTRFLPWSGYWWPIREGRLLVPLGKYDRLTGYKAAVWEKKHNPPGPNVPQWHGYCHAWSAASVLELEPTIERMVRTERARLGLGVGDQKGLLTACHTEDLANSWGDRYGDGIGSEDRQDLSPDLLWRLLKLHVGQQGVPLVLDVESGEEVWNYPIYNYEIRYKASGRSVYSADLTLLMADDAVPPDYQGTKTRKQTYKFSFKMRQGSVVSGSGEWIGRSKQDHPDFAWYPFKAVASNPEVKYAKVRQLVEGGPSPPDPSPPVEPPTEPEPKPAPKPPPKPAPKPAPEPVTPPVGPGRAEPLVISPMELVALILDKTSSFGLDMTVDRFDGATYYVGERFFVRCAPERAGYLYLIQIDPKGLPALLYPTRGEDNRIGADKSVAIPSENSQTGFLVPALAGTVRVKALVTRRPLALTGVLTAAQQQGTANQTSAAQEKELPPGQFRWHPTQRRQIQELLRERQPDEGAQPVDTADPKELLGPFAQDEAAFYVERRPNQGAGNGRRPRRQKT